MKTTKYEKDSLESSWIGQQALLCLVSKRLKAVAMTALLLALLPIGTNAWAQSSITVMEWNIRGLGNNGTWPQAGSDIIQYILDSGAHVISIQEARRAVDDMMADAALSDRFNIYQPTSDNPILVDRSLRVTSDGPSGIGRCSPGTVATIELPSGAGSFRLYNNHFCVDGRNADEGRDLVRIADPANSPDMIIAPGDLNTSAGFNPGTISELLSSGFIDTWDHTGNALRKPDVEWILINSALVDGASVTNARADDSCTANTQDGQCSDHQAFFVDLDFSSAADDLVLMNGNILTMDSFDSVVSAVRIRNGRFVAVGDDVGSVDEGDTVIDLDGRTVTPGLIDSHIHFIQPSQAPGHFLSAIETAFSIGALEDALVQRATSVPAGEFITALGGLGPRQFAENRLPNLTELDGAAPNHPVYLQVGMNGPAVTNSLGKDFFEAAGISISADGTINGQVGPALQLLIEDQTDAEARRAAIEYMEYANSLGLTTVTDQGCCNWSGVNLPQDEIYGRETFYDLWEQDALTVRLRLEYGGGGAANSDGIYPSVRQMEAALQALQDLGGGDDMLDIVGVGEFSVGSFGDTQAPFEDAYLQIAERGWKLSQHSGTVAEHEAHLAAFEAVDATVPIAGLRWALEHAYEVSDDQMARLLTIGAGVTVSDTEFLRLASLPPQAGGPPFRSFVDSGIHVGGSSDSSNVSPMNPWLALYYMVSGKNAAGDLVNDGQQISRLEALRLYTQSSAWFSFADELGSIEVGKLADLAVLSDDYLSIPEEEIKTLSSLLTLVGGEVVYIDEDIFTPLDEPDVTINVRKRKFGDVEVGDSARLRKAIVTNEGTQSLHIFAIKIRGANRSQFTLPANRDGCSRTNLEPMQSCNFRVGFEPTKAGLKKAKVVIKTTDPDESKIRVKLRGTGTD